MEKAFCCAPDFPVVQTNYGPVRGYRFREISSFKGIPYGRAVRFHAPQPPQPWAEPLDASSYGCVCPLLSIDKPSGELRVPHRYWVQDEDCLNLNIWTPACDAQKRPVLVWLHGGGFFAGSSIEQVAYEGGNMAREGDCVVVSLNHRLNILGYLDLSDFGEEYANSGNAGGDDIILALQWVRDNIAAFGGDPGCVTVFGQSGGGAKVTTLLQTPAADGLYHRAMIMSGVLEGLLNDSVGSGRDCVQALMQELGVQTAQQLETVPYHQLAQAYRNVSPALKAKGANVGQSPHPNRFYLGDPLQNGSGFRPETVDVPVLIGTVYSEFYGFFDGLKGVGPEEAVGLSAAETLREQFRTLKALMGLYVFGQKDNNGVYLADGSAAKLEYPLNEGSVAHAADRFRYLYETLMAGTNAKVYLSVIPDKNYFLAEANGYPALDYQALTDALRKQTEFAAYIDLFGTLTADDYYRTDSHWRQENLLTTADTLAAAMGVALPGNRYTKWTLDRPYYGVYYGYAALPMEPDQLTYLTSDLLDACTVYNYETGKTGPIYDLAKGAGKDPYELFLSGSVSLLTIANPNADADRKLVIFRDSFGSSLAPLLVPGYAKVTLADIRYLPSSQMGKYLTFTDQDVLFLYSAPVLNNSETLK